MDIHNMDGLSKVRFLLFLIIIIIVISLLKS